MPASTIVQASEFECNNDALIFDDPPVNDNAAFAAAVTELHTILCEAVTCAPGCSGVVWARYHASVAQYGFPAAVEALNRFAVTQKPGAA